MRIDAKGKSAAGARAGRLRALRERLRGKGVDAAVLTRREDLFYFTGYTGDDAMAVVGPRLKALVTDFRYREEAERTAPGMDVVMWKGGMAGHVGAMLAKAGARVVGHVWSAVSLAAHTAMRSACSGRRWVDVGAEVAALRAVKDAGEIRAVRKALACAEAAFDAARQRWRIGMTEIDVKNDLEWEMRRRGAEDAAFETIVAAGPNASLPHAHAGRRKVAAGKMLLVDFGARVERYNSDLTRTLWPGQVSKAWRERYLTVLEAQAAALEAIAPGVPGRLPDSRAREVFKAKGWEEMFGHGLGHGVGLAVHEDPRLGTRSDAPLAVGNVVTVEPGLYFPASGGIRVEDMVEVAAGGCRVLSSLGKRLDDIVL